MSVSDGRVSLLSGAAIFDVFCLTGWEREREPLPRCGSGSCLGFETVAGTWMTTGSGTAGGFGTWLVGRALPNLRTTRLFAAGRGRPLLVMTPRCEMKPITG